MLKSAVYIKCHSVLLYSLIYATLVLFGSLYTELDTHSCILHGWCAQCGKSCPSFIRFSNKAAHDITHFPCPVSFLPYCSLCLLSLYHLMPPQVLPTHILLHTTSDCITLKSIHVSLLVSLFVMLFCLHANDQTMQQRFPCKIPGI